MKAATTTIALGASTFIHRGERESHRPTVTCLLPLKTFFSRMSQDLWHYGEVVFVRGTARRIKNVQPWIKKAISFS